MNSATQWLTPFGFTDLESRLYGELLKQSPLTGYRLSRAVGKAAANTYQALESLTRKGAVLADEAEPRNYRAVPPAELFAALRRTFTQQAEAAESGLSALYTPTPEERLYQLKSLPQALERARALIEGAKEIVLFDLFPQPLAELREYLIRAQARGVRVGGITYGDAPPETGDAPFIQVVAPGAGFVTERWPGRQMTLIADAREVLLALIAPDDASLSRGFWSDSPYLACLHHSGLASEMRLSAALTRGGDPLRDFGLLSATPPGLRQLTGLTSIPKP
ncbi:MAG: helix-turn-helix domain-containing protein [Asticcacaulis sp.]